MTSVTCPAGHKLARAPIKASHVDANVLNALAQTRRSCDDALCQNDTIRTGQSRMCCLTCGYVMCMPCVFRRASSASAAAMSAPVGAPPPAAAAAGSSSHAASSSAAPGGSGSSGGNFHVSAIVGAPPPAAAAAGSGSHAASSSAAPGGSGSGHSGHIPIQLAVPMAPVRPLDLLGQGRSSHSFAFGALMRPPFPSLQPSRPMQPVHPKRPMPPPSGLAAALALGKRRASESSLPAASELYQRQEHQYLAGPVRARPGDCQRFEWGKLVVQALPRPPLSVHEGDDRLCAGCRYAIDHTLATARCERCHRLFHANREDDEQGSCFGDDRHDQANTRFCIECLPPHHPFHPTLRQQQREVLSIVYDFERWGFTVVKVEKIHNVRLARVYEHTQEAMAERRPAGAIPSWPNEQRRYHLSSAGWGHVCETGLDVERASEGLFGKALYFSPDPKKCDDYWRRATKHGNDAAAVSVASTGKDPMTTRIMFACKVLLGRTKEFGAQQYDKSLRAAPGGYDSVAGIINGQRELAIYANEQALLDYMVTYELPHEVALSQAQAHDVSKQRQQIGKAHNLQALQRTHVKQPEGSKERERQRVDLQRVGEITQWDTPWAEGSTIATLNGDMCSICLDPLVISDEPTGTAALTDSTPVRLGKCCGHGFHAGCLLQCFKPAPPMHVPATPQAIREQWPDNPLCHNFLMAVGRKENIVGHVVCPLCKQMYGVRTGDAPEGFANLDHSDSVLPGTGTARGHFTFNVYIPGCARPSSVL